MSQKLSILSGESCTLGISFQEERIDYIDDINIYINKQVNGSLEGGSIVRDGDLFLFKIKSSDTHKLVGNFSVILSISFTDLGVRKTKCKDFVLSVSKCTSDFNVDLDSDIVDATINVAIEENNIATDVILAQIYRGYSSYEIAVQNGFEGTELEWTQSQQAKNYIKKSEIDGNIYYFGVALEGTLETDEEWKVTKITINQDGTYTKLVRENIAWTNR